MKNTSGKLILTIGLGMLVYTGYQAMTYRESLRLTQQEFVGLPVSLLSLLAVAVAVSLVGGLQSSGELKPILLADAPQPTVLRPQQIDFVTFDGRGSILSAVKTRSRKNGPAMSEQTSSATTMT
ncbi:hypothetical protein Ndes2526B_g05308 [Nannochloris sp. 'desiccata']